MSCPRQKAVLAACLGALVAACSTGAGDGSVSGALDLPACGVETDDYDMDVTFFAASYFDNTLTIRLQRTGDDQTFTDGVHILVRDLEETGERLGEEVAVEVVPAIETFVEDGPDAGAPTTTGGSPARITLYLNETCPGNRLAFTDGAGTLRFDHIYLPDEKKRIAGEFELEFIDPRYWESPEDPGPRAWLSGKFDFNYTRGSPAQPFP